MVPRRGPGGNLSSSLGNNLPPGLFMVITKLSHTDVTGLVHPAIDLYQKIWLQIEDKFVLDTVYKELETNCLGSVSFHITSTSFDINNLVNKFGVGASHNKPVVIKQVKSGYTVIPVTHVSLLTTDSMIIHSYLHTHFLIYTLMSFSGE
jgi:hypothetical protein